MSTCAIYCRVSTVGQVSGDPWASLPRQLADLQQLAERLGLAVALEEVEQASGAKADRPGWARVLDAARSGAIGAILVVSFDRLTRSERIGDWEDVKRELRALGVRLITIKQGEIDLSGTADAETRSDFDAVLSKRERLVIRERTMAGRDRKGAAGGYTGHQPPHGYVTRFDDTTGARRFEVDAQAAATILRIFSEYAAGKRLAAIARDLKAEGVPPPTSRCRPGDGRHWYHQTVSTILTNPVYIGHSSWRRGRVEPPRSTVFPPIIDRDLWDEAQTAVSIAKLRSPRGPHKPRPLSGILRCRTCAGSLVYRQKGNGKGDGPPCYTCHGYAQLRSNPCPERQMLNSRIAEEAVLAYLAERLPAYLKGAAPPAGKKPGGELARIERAVADVKTKQSRLLDWMLSQDSPPPEADTKLADLRRELEHLEGRRVAALQAHAPRPRRSIRGLASLAEVLARGVVEPDDRRALFEAAVLTVTLVKTSPLRARPQRLEVERLVLRNGDEL